MPGLGCQRWCVPHRARDQTSLISLASCRSATCRASSPHTRLTRRPRCTAGRAAISAAQRRTCSYSCTERNSAASYRAPSTQHAVPGINRDVGNAVFVARHVAVVGQMAIEYVQLAFDFHAEAIDRVFELLGRVGIEVAKAAARYGAEPSARTASSSLRCACRDPLAAARQTFRPDTAGWSRTRIPGRRVGAVIQQGRNLRVWVDGNKITAELIAFVDANQPGIVFGIRMAQRQQLLEHDGRLDSRWAWPANIAGTGACRPAASSRGSVRQSGRLMLANLPPFSLSQVQTLGGV